MPSSSLRVPEARSATHPTLARTTTTQIRSAARICDWSRRCGLNRWMQHLGMLTGNPGYSMEREGSRGKLSEEGKIEALWRPRRGGTDREVAKGFGLVGGRTRRDH